MGRKIEMKKIENTIKRQITFSKRRNHLMKIANEISVICGVDVAVIAFSFTGRVSKFCNQNRIEDVLHHFVNLPADTRLIEMTNVQDKVDKLQGLNHIIGETSKLHYLDEQIKNFELRIKMTELETQIEEANLCCYEPRVEQEPSLEKFSWCEGNLQHLLERAIGKKMDLEMENQQSVQFATTFNNNPVGQPTNLSIKPYSAIAHGILPQDLPDQANSMPNHNPGQSNMSNTILTGSHFSSGSGSKFTAEAQMPPVYEFQEGFPAADTDGWMGSSELPDMNNLLLDDDFNFTAFNP